MRSVGVAGRRTASWADKAGSVSDWPNRRQRSRWVCQGVSPESQGDHQGPRRKADCRCRFGGKRVAGCGCGWRAAQNESLSTCIRAWRRFRLGETIRNTCKYVASVKNTPSITPSLSKARRLRPAWGGLGVRTSSQQTFETALGVLHCWRDDAAHGVVTALGETEASAVRLLALSAFRADRGLGGFSRSRITTFALGRDCGSSKLCSSRRSLQRDVSPYQKWFTALLTNRAFLFMRPPPWAG